MMGVDNPAQGSFFDRAPRDLSIKWQGCLRDRWRIALSCTIEGADQAEALCEIIRILSAASEPSDSAAMLAARAHTGDTHDQ